MSGVLIFGAGGQVGKELSTIINGAESFAHSGQDKVVNVENFAELETAFSGNPPEIVINASAYTDVDVSTDYVFMGKAVIIRRTQKVV